MSSFEQLNNCAYLTDEIMLCIFYWFLLYLLQKNVILPDFCEQAYTNLLLKLCLFCIKLVNNVYMDET